MRRILNLLLIVAIAATLAVSLEACGRKGDLDPPDGKKSDFPRQYPR